MKLKDLSEVVRMHDVIIRATGTTRRGIWQEYVIASPYEINKWDGYFEKTFKHFAESEVYEVTPDVLIRTMVLKITLKNCSIEDVIQYIQENQKEYLP